MADAGEGEGVKFRDCRRIIVVDKLSLLLLLFVKDVCVKFGDEPRASAFSPDLFPGVSVGVGKPLYDGLTTLPVVSARGLRFKLAGRGRAGDGLVTATVGVNVVGARSSTGDVTMKVRSSARSMVSSSSSSSSTRV